MNKTLRVRVTFPDCGRNRTRLTSVEPTPKQQLKNQRLATKIARQEEINLANIILARRKMGIKKMRTMLDKGRRIIRKMFPRLIAKGVKKPGSVLYTVPRPPPAKQTTDDAMNEKMPAGWVNPQAPPVNPFAVIKIG